MKTVVGYAVFLLACGYACAAMATEPGEYLSYDDFIRAVDAGQIESVRLDSYSRFEGTRVVDGVKRPFHSYADTGSANDPLLLR
ncbi:MAG: hypothetical protein V1736_05500, partial [Pseudomonadota bacterium]